MGSPDRAQSRLNRHCSNDRQRRGGHWDYVGVHRISLCSGSPRGGPAAPQQRQASTSHVMAGRSCVQGPGLRLGLVLPTAPAALTPLALPHVQATACGSVTYGALQPAARRASAGR